MLLIIDLKAVKLKDLQNKRANGLLSSLLVMLQKYYPEMMLKCYILNTPIFFQDYFEQTIKPALSPSSFKKIMITGEAAHPELTKSVS